MREVPKPDETKQKFLYTKANLTDWLPRLLFVAAGQTRLLGIADDHYDLAMPGVVLRLNQMFQFMSLSRPVQDRGGSVVMQLDVQGILPLEMLGPVDCAYVTPTFVWRITDQAEPLRDKILDMYFAVVDPPLIQRPSLIKA